jgi:hypothetical protein
LSFDGRISRRDFVSGSLTMLAWPQLASANEQSPGQSSADVYVTPDGKPSRILEAALAGSPYVYVSPLHPDGRESRCHGEIWFAWLDGAVVSSTSTNGWKARAIASGRDRARLWVGNYGRWKNRLGGTNVGFRHGPTFVARAAVSKDPALLERILAVYAKKYPDEIDRWASRMRTGLAAGERVLLRYTPIAS